MCVIVLTTVCFLSIFILGCATRPSLPSLPRIDLPLPDLSSLPNPLAKFRKDKHIDDVEIAPSSEDRLNAYAAGANDFVERNRVDVERALDAFPSDFEIRQMAVDDGAISPGTTNQAPTPEQQPRRLPSRFWKSDRNQEAPTVASSSLFRR